MKYNLLISVLHLFLFSKAQTEPTAMDYSKLSQTLLYAIRTGNSSHTYIQQLATANGEQLRKELSTDAYKKAFWLNIYNAFVQKLLTDNPGKYKKRNSFFSDQQITIAGKQLSLDDIEHGILRRSKTKWSFGYINKLFPSSFERSSRVERLDNRIHFALNCGAKSCPPVAYYEPEKIDKQLELAARSYLGTEVEYDKSSGLIYLPKIMSWFRADFRGKKGIINLLTKYHLIDDGAVVKIKFKAYDWDLYLSNYKTE